MIKPVLFCAVIFFTTTQFAASGRISIVTSPDNPCPGERNGLFCLTLQQFVSSGIITRIENLTLELEPGVHVLGSALSVTGRKNLEITGDNSTIVCTRGYSLYTILNIQSAQNVNISGITFVNCSRVYFSSTSRAIISRSNFHGLFSTGLELSYTTASIHSCTFAGKNIGMRLYQPSANISIDSCTFIGNRQGIYFQERSRNISIDSCTFIGNRQSIYLPSDYYRGTTRINNCTFRNNGLINYSGSAVYCGSDLLVIAQSTFINNTASSGVIFYNNPYYHSNQLFSIDRCTFINNMANGRGGVLYFNIGNINSRYYSRMCSISGSVFINNRATVSGGAIYAIGNLTVADSIFGYNSAPQCAVIETGSSTSQNFYTHVVLTSSTFLYNRAINSTTSSINSNNNNFIFGGVACFSASTVMITNSTFSHSTAAGGGGVMTVENSNITISRSSFYNNTAGVDGGVLYTFFSSSNYTVTESSFTYNHAGDDGGAVFIGGAGSRVEISRSTFSHNTAVDQAGAIIVFRGSFGVTQTNMFGNRATSGDDVGICGSSINTTTSTYFSFHFRLQTPSSECMYYGDFRVIFPLPNPEDRSNMNVAHYLQIPGAVSNASFIVAPASSVVSTTSSTTTTEDQSLKEIQSKLRETSTVTYTFFTIVLLFVAILVVIVVMKFCLKKKGKHRKYNLSTKSGHNASESNHYNDNIIAEIYEEPVWKEGPTSAIKLKPNVVYSKNSV